MVQSSPSVSSFELDSAKRIGHLSISMVNEQLSMLKLFSTRNCQALVPNPVVPKPNPKPVQPSSKSQKNPRGLGLTLKSYGPPHRHWLLHIDTGSHPPYNF